MTDADRSNVDADRSSGNAEAAAPDAADYDVAVIGGGPAGCSTAVFTARYGLDTVVFDRGRSSLRQCAHLENYLGFPAGVDVETFYDLAHEHVERAGGELIPELVETVECEGDGPFRLATQDDSRVTARFVVAAAKYDAEYLRGLDEPAMFVPDEHRNGEERFDESYPDADGSTPLDGLFAAGPLAGVADQAIVAAGHGATVGRAVIAADRRANGWWDEVAEPRDWRRRRASLDEPWTERDAWIEWFDDRYDVDERGDLDDELVERVRATVIDRELGTYLDDEEVDRRAEAGQRRLLATLDADLVLERAAEIEDEREQSADNP